MRKTRALPALALTAALVVAMPSAPAAAAHGVVDRAAFGVSSTGLVDVGPAAHCAPTTSFGDCEREVMGVAEPGLTTGVLRVRTSGTHQPLKADSEATVDEADLTFGGAPIFFAQTIKSTCVADESGLTGATVLADVDILGVEPPAPFNAAEPPPNTLALDTDLVRIVLNEQITSDRGRQINVNAVHVTIFDPSTGAVVQDVVLASTQCSLRVPKTRVRGAVRMIDKCGRDGDAFLAKRVRGVTYRVKGRGVIREGDWLKAKTRTVRVRAVASRQRYRVVGEDVWVLRFTNKPCPTPPGPLPPTGARWSAE